MRTHYPYLEPGEKPITTVDEYLLLREDYDNLERYARKLRERMKSLKGIDEDECAKLYQELQDLKPLIANLESQLSRRTPIVLISICPFCNTEIWQKLDIFSILHRCWHYERGNGKFVSEGSQCPHLFCIDGALNLHGRQPKEQRQAFTSFGATSIDMAAEVPFVKPRVLNLPTMRAVICSFPVADVYTAYPIVYFAERQPAEHINFCIPWARSAFLGWHPYMNKRKIGFIGKRSDHQDYDLFKWIERGKVLWVAPRTEDRLIDGPVQAFPYAHVCGRRHPYSIQEGIVHDLPDPVESKPEIILGDLVDHHS